MNYDKILDNIFWKDKIWNRSASCIMKNRTYSNIKNYLINRYEDSTCWKESIYRIHFNIEHRPVCPYCGNEVAFIGKQKLPFAKYCSTSCRAKDVSVHYFVNGQREYNIKHYGVASNFSIPKCQEVRKQHIIEQYGSLRAFHLACFEKANATCEKIYGMPFIEIRYSEENLRKTKENGELPKTKSRCEDRTYKRLLKLYPDTLREYIDFDRYPFKCDFYVPSKDLFIECNFHPSHGPHPWTDSESDNYLLDSLNEIYGEKNMLTWTTRDPLKREIAKENNLNYVEFWTEREAAEWIRKKRLDIAIQPPTS